MRYKCRQKSRSSGNPVRWLISGYDTGSIADLVFSSRSPGQTTLTYSTECTFVDPDNIPIAILGYGAGVIHAQ